ncbi:MAG: aspartate--tRNA ligase [Myxococcales bacterium]|nr:aspartate--tRNA ligase [Myxococcales bacterium]
MRKGPARGALEDAGESQTQDTGGKTTVARFIDDLRRTHYCGQLRATDIGREVVLFGWVAHRRDFGGCVFIDLRDREGIAQVVFDTDYVAGEVERIPALLLRGEAFQEEAVVAGAHALAEEVRREWVIGVRGVVVHRGEKNKNPKLATGEIEVRVAEAVVFNRAETPPFAIEDDIATDEEVRLRHRYVDLRRGSMQRTLRLRHRLNQATRSFLSEAGAIELETPILCKYTPGGARNFLVPSRLSPGKFYALAESPQLFKQLFMVAGFDKYFQIVKCFRDEDLRLDRQPEFTQIDIEMSFIAQDDIFRLLESLMFRLFQETGIADLPALFPSGRFPQLEFAESMRRFGNDKPDLRFGLELVELTELAILHEGGGLPLAQEIVAKFANGTYRRDVPAEIVKAFVIPASAGFARPQLEAFEQGLREIKGCKGLARAKVAADGSWTQSPLSKHVSDAFRLAINEATGAKENDVICFQFGDPDVVNAALSKLRLDVAKKMGLIPQSGHGGEWRFLWVVNPPMFERTDEGGWVAAHHAFTRPADECVPLLETDPARVNCYRYDLVLNGFEIGGGSIRLHDPEVQERVFRVLGIGAVEAREKFGFLLDALRSGAPPHGGIAIGMDRLAMLATGAPTLREVIPFPKTNQGVDLMSQAPVIVDRAQLDELKVASTVPREG